MPLQQITYVDLMDGYLKNYSDYSKGYNMTEEWKQHLISAEYALEALTSDQVATVAKMLALQVGSYRKVFGDQELERLQAFINVTELDDEAKAIFILGMEALLAVVRQIETTGADIH